MKPSEINLNDIMSSLKKEGFEKGDTIPYHTFIETCESLDINPDEVNIEKITERYDVAIG